MRKQSRRLRLLQKLKLTRLLLLRRKVRQFNLKTKAISKKVTYKVTGKKSAKKYIKVSKNGKVTIKKGIKKGTYKIVIKAKATKNHKQGKKVVKITIK